MSRLRAYIRIGRSAAGNDAMRQRLLFATTGLLLLVANFAFAQHSPDQQVPPAHNQGEQTGAEVVGPPPNSPKNVSGTRPINSSIESSATGQASVLYPGWVSSALKDLQTLIQTLAIIVAGVWAYFKFAAGRILRKKLETNVTAEIIEDNEYSFVCVRMAIKNVGLTKVDINHDGSSLMVKKSEIGWSDIILTGDWEQGTRFSILKDHHWIEARETIEDNQLLVFPGIDIAVLYLELRVSNGKNVWIAKSLVGVDRSKKGDS